MPDLPVREPTRDEPDVPDLRDYLVVLRRRRWTVIGIAAVVVATALAVTVQQDPVYEAAVRLLVTPAGAPEDDSLLREIVLGQSQLDTQRELVRSVPVAERAVDRLELDRSPRELLEEVTVEVVRDTQILEIRVTALVPEEAATVAQAMAESYLDFRRDQAVERAVSAAASLQDRLASIRQRLDEIDAAAAGAGPADRQALDRERDALLVQLGQGSAQLASLRSAESFTRGGGEIVEAAEPPTEPVSPRPVRNGTLALVLGLLLGVGVAFLRDHLDDAVRSDEELVGLTGRPVLGQVPPWDTGPRGQGPTVVPPLSPVAEAYRTLRTNLRFLAVAEPTRSLLVTSAQPGEGKTTTAANLAVAAARVGDRVLLVGADLRRPALHRVFAVPADTGLSEVVAGEVPLADVVRDVGIDNLRVVPAGGIPPNPSELLAASRMDAFMAKASELADLVVYDVPPLLGVADALELVPRVDGVLLVVDGGRASRHAVRGASERIGGVGGRLLGAVMNRLDPGAAASGYYGYYYTAYEAGSGGEAGNGRRGRKGTRARDG